MLARAGNERQRILFQWLLAAGTSDTALPARLPWDSLRQLPPLYTVAVAPCVARIAARAARAAPDSASYADRCMLEQWRLEHGDTRTVDHAVRVLDAAPQPGARLCARVLATRAALIRGSANAGALLDSLNALARTVPPDWEPWFTHGNLIIARCSSFYTRGKTDRGM